MQTKKQWAILDALKSRSRFFCPAKWQELYLYLNHGTSNSCHHPLPHEIPEQLLDDPWVLHNTPHKLARQQEMIAGQRPQECHMCWHIEDLGDDVPSDRVWKSQQWQSDIAGLQVNPRHVPPFIEVVFDNHCNLACSYCDAGQSSRWAAQIHQRPLWLASDHRNLYSRIHIAPGSVKQPYLDAWMAWWPQIQSQVRMLKVSGGEPTMSPRFWQFVDSLGLAPDLEFMINSNFSVPADTITRLAAVSTRVRSVLVGASIDAVGAGAEYVRQGLDYNKFLANVEYWLQEAPANCYLYLQGTVNVLSVWHLTHMFDLAIKLRQQYPQRVQEFYATVVRFPEFQSVNILPQHLRQRLANDIKQWSHRHCHDLGPQEQLMVDKISGYLEHEPESMYDFDLDTLQADFVRFLLYYEQSSRHRYQDIYPPDFVAWVEDIQQRL